VPDGVDPATLDADGDGEVLAVLDLRMDASLVEVGAGPLPCRPPACLLHAHTPTRRGGRCWRRWRLDAL
jgi:hypothetical protein